MSFITPFLIGLFSGLHCVTMCTALCHVICHQKQLNIVIVTNIGRIITYMLLGIIFTVILQGTILSFDLAIIGFWIRMMMGGMMIFIGLYLMLQLKSQFLKLHKGLPLWSIASNKLSMLKNKSRLHHYLIKGMLWGMIPCGLLYGVLIVAVTTADVFRAGQFMLFFGLGTLAPLLLSQQLFYKLQRTQQFLWIKKASGVFIIFLGLWIIIGPWISHQLIPENNRFFIQLTAVLDLCLP